MSGYIFEFLLYTLGMTGILLFGYILTRRCLQGDPIPFLSAKFKDQKKKRMIVEELLRLEPGKNIYILNIEGERYLISSHNEGVSFLSNLQNSTALFEKVETDFTERPRSMQGQIGVNRNKYQVSNPPRFNIPNGTLT